MRRVIPPPPHVTRSRVRGNRYFTYVTLTPSLVKTSHVGDDYSDARRDDKINMILYAHADGSARDAAT